MRFTIGVLGVIVALGTAYALDGTNGSVATPVFNATDVVTSTTYPSGFDGVRWNDSSFFLVDFGLLDNSAFLASDRTGGVYAIVVGHRESSPRPRGLVRWNGSGFLQLVQYPNDYDETTGAFTRVNVRAVAVSPTTTGLMTAGHAVIARGVIDVGPNGASEARWDLTSVDPSTSPATETRVHDCSIAIRAMAIDASGCIFVHDGSVVLKLTFDGTSYDEEVVANVALQWGQLAIGSDGALYAMPGQLGWGVRKGVNDILRVDPDTGVTSAYAHVSRRFRGVWALTSDVSGRLWLGLEEGSDADVVVEVVEGATIDSRTPEVAVSLPGHARTMVAGVDGRILVAEWDDAWEETQAFVLEPVVGTDGGSGGGNGGGKGKSR